MTRPKASSLRAAVVILIPDVVQAFLAVEPEILQIKQRLDGGLIEEARTEYVTSVAHVLGLSGRYGVESVSLFACRQMGPVLHVSGLLLPGHLTERGLDFRMGRPAGFVSGD